MKLLILTAVLAATCLIVWNLNVSAACKDTLVTSGSDTFTFNCGSGTLTNQEVEDLLVGWLRTPCRNYGIRSMFSKHIWIPNSMPPGIRRAILH